MIRFNKVLIVLIVGSLIGCSTKLTPAVYFNNISNDKIKNISGSWNNYELSDEWEINPGQSVAQHFYIKYNSDFFGPVHLEWQNAFGKKFTKDFEFKENDLPHIGNKKNYNFVIFYFTQNGVEYYTSNHPNIKKIEKEKHDLMMKLHGDFSKKK